MPQLIAIGLIGGLAWYAWRAFQKQMDTISEDAKRKEEAKAVKEVAPLEKGPDGVYRPRKDD